MTKDKSLVPETATGTTAGKAVLEGRIAGACEDMTHTILQTLTRPLQRTFTPMISGDGTALYSFPLPRTMDRPFSIDEVARIRTSLLNTMSIALDGSLLRHELPGLPLRLDMDNKRNVLTLSIPADFVEALAQDLAHKSYRAIRTLN